MTSLISRSNFSPLVSHFLTRSVKYFTLSVINSQSLDLSQSSRQAQYDQRPRLIEALLQLFWKSVWGHFQNLLIWNSSSLLISLLVSSLSQSLNLCLILPQDLSQAGYVRDISQDLEQQFWDQDRGRSWISCRDRISFHNPKSNRNRRVSLSRRR